MNVRIIDPGKSVSSRGATWNGRDAFDDLDDDEEPEPAGDDRFDLLVDLKALSLAYLRHAEGPAELGRRAGTVERDLVALRRLGEQAGLPPVPAPRVDLAEGFAALAAQAAVDGFDPFESGADLLTGALVLNALGLAVIQAFLGESDAGPWRPLLLPMLAEDARFEGWLTGELARCGDEAVERAAGLRALASGPAPGGQRLWSFDLLRMAISRLLCGGQPGHRGGFFPGGMSGTAG